MMSERPSEPNRVEDREGTPHARQGRAERPQRQHQPARGDGRVASQGKEGLVALHDALADEDDAVEQLEARAAAQRTPGGYRLGRHRHAARVESNEGRDKVKSQSSLDSKNQERSMERLQGRHD